MGRNDVDGQPLIAVAFLLFVCAALFEVVAISQTDETCGGPAWASVLVFSVPFLWLGGIVSLYLATRDRALRGSRLTGFGGLAAIVVGIAFLPTLASPFTGCFS